MDNFSLLSSRVCVEKFMYMHLCSRALVGANGLRVNIASTTATQPLEIESNDR